MQTRHESPLPVYEDTTLFDSRTEDSSKASLSNRYTGVQGAASEQNNITSKSLSDYSFLPPPPSLPSFVLDSTTTRPEMPSESKKNAMTALIILQLCTHKYLLKVID